MDGEQIRRMESYAFDVDPMVFDVQDVEALSAKLTAEHERLLRLLPDPPQGYRWKLALDAEELVQTKHRVYRVVATLKEI